MQKGQVKTSEDSIIPSSMLIQYGKRMFGGQDVILAVDIKITRCLPVNISSLPETDQNSL